MGVPYKHTGPDCLLVGPYGQRVSRGETMELDRALTPDHPWISQGWLRRLDTPPPSAESSEPLPVGDASRSDLWRMIGDAEGGKTAYTEQTGRGFRDSSADDLRAYLEAL